MLRNDYIPEEALPAGDVNDIVDAIFNNTHNILELYLENYYASLSTPSRGLFFDGFSDTSKMDGASEAITGAVSSAQADVAVADGTSFSVGQEVDIFDTTTGVIETKIIQSIATNTLTMTTNFSNAYTTSGFVVRSSVDLDTVGKTIEIQPELSFGVYRSNLVQFQQGVDLVKVWITRTLTTSVNRYNPQASIANGATSLTIAGDHRTSFSDGETIDISNATNTVRERKTINGTPSYSGGNTTIAFTPAIVNGSGFGTTGIIERIDIIPQMSLVAEGATESFDDPDYVGTTVDFANDTAEDEYQMTATDVHDYILKLTLT